MNIFFSDITRHLTECSIDAKLSAFFFSKRFIHVVHPSTFIRMCALSDDLSPFSVSLRFQKDTRVSTAGLVLFIQSLFSSMTSFDAVFLLFLLILVS